jgi:hypothetical protein
MFADALRAPQGSYMRAVARMGGCTQPRSQPLDRFLNGRINCINA